MPEEMKTDPPPPPPADDAQAEGLPDLIADESNDADDWSIDLTDPFLPIRMTPKRLQQADPKPVFVFASPTGADMRRLRPAWSALESLGKDGQPVTEEAAEAAQAGIYDALAGQLIRWEHVRHRTRGKLKWDDAEPVTGELLSEVLSEPDADEMLLSLLIGAQLGVPDQKKSEQQPPLGSVAAAPSDAEPGPPSPPAPSGPGPSPSAELSPPPTPELDPPTQRGARADGHGMPG
ncbi:MAG: hypothetical protein AAGI68_12160 [Planctomycetota bacterium]